MEQLPLINDWRVHYKRRSTQRFNKKRKRWDTVWHIDYFAVKDNPEFGLSQLGPYPTRAIAQRIADGKNNG